MLVSVLCNAGRSKEKIEADTMIPDENPNMILLILSDIFFLKKNTTLLPNVVQTNMIDKPKSVYKYFSKERVYQIYVAYR